ncbi:hypothetical protein HNR42_002496 [Deinobacterium chartae]|uniref:Lipoprotein n=1 Tax=Deinobacterium chartae TaxID=521158 RepID=A0A841I3R9_9DEIO|nr:hypothetical protein [Deinobacterium chartae]MBB6099060.1 hypothetical protein [Deinobacterium chartae]
MGNLRNITHGTTITLALTSCGQNVLQGSNLATREQRQVYFERLKDEGRVPQNAQLVQFSKFKGSLGALQAIPGIAYCEGELNTSETGDSAGAHFQTFCFGVGSKLVVQSTQRVRLENINTQETDADESFSINGITYLIAVLPNHPQTPLYCARGWMSATYWDGEKQQGQTPGTCWYY